MKFSDREDVAAPLETVFAAISDFDGFERAAMRRGIDVERIVPGKDGKPAWDVAFEFRGRKRKVLAELVRHDPQEALQVDLKGSGLNGCFEVELVQLSPRQTRMIVKLELTPRTLPARLFLHSLRLAKTSLQKRFDKAIIRFARDLEARG